MTSLSKNRVQAIKKKFENLNCENDIIILKKNNSLIETEHLFKYKIDAKNVFGCLDESSVLSNKKKSETESEVSSDDSMGEPNSSYLHNRSDLTKALIETKTSLTRQSSDPGKKLHRSHAFRGDKNQLLGPKRQGSCHGRPENSQFPLNMSDKKLSTERLKKLGDLLEDQMKKENFDASKTNLPIGYNSIPDADVPQHILDQYAKVLKPMKPERQDTMTDSGVSSETENLEEEKQGSKIMKLKTQFENSEPIKPVVTNAQSNLEVMGDMGGSCDTMTLERRNPHVVLTDTLKKALKQPLPPGPPPKKPPRTFTSTPSTIIESPEKEKKDAKLMLKKLEQVLQKREVKNQVENIYDVVETDLSPQKPKEIHYLCTEILDIAQKTLLPNQNKTDTIVNCFNSLNCAIANKNSTASLPYSRLSLNPNRNSLRVCLSESSDSIDKEYRPRLSTFLSDKGEKNIPPALTLANSKFYVDDKNIYDLPCVESVPSSSKTVKQNVYGSLYKFKENGVSRSMEDLSVHYDDTKIYDIPCEISRPATPEPNSSQKTDFEKLLHNFENSSRIENNNLNTKKPITIEKAKPLLTPKPNFSSKFKMSKSSENLIKELHSTKEFADKKFATESKKNNRRFKQNDKGGFSLPKNETRQLEVDRQNLSRLMNEIYETVTAACDMENKPGSFPTDQSDGSTSEESVKLTRSLTEKRKNYVRRVSSRAAFYNPKNTKSVRYRHQTSVCSYKSEIIDNPYSTFRSWKSFRTSQNNLSKDNKMADRSSLADSKVNLTDSRGNVMSMKDDFSISVDSVDTLSIDEKAGCVDIELPFEMKEKRLFNVCLLAGLNYMTGQAYVKSVFPAQVQVPPHIENLIFPETLIESSKMMIPADAEASQCYSLVLTDERGERSYGYCRRVLPEGATTCLPLCYCIIAKYRAPGYYYKILQEIESHHGSSEVEIHSILQQLFECEFPSPGEKITIDHASNQTDFIKNSLYRNSVNMGDVLKSKTMPAVNRQSVNLCDSVKSNGVQVKDLPSKCLQSERLFDCYDLENNNGPNKIFLSLDKPRTKILKYPLEPRMLEHGVCTLAQNLGAGLMLKVFGSMLLERKVLICADKLSVLSSCMEALQSILYPFVWQQPLISTVPSEIQRDVLEAPLPILAGTLPTNLELDKVSFEEGMLIDLTNSNKVIFYQGDESTILPTSSYKTLKTSLHMEINRQKDADDEGTKNVMLSEAFLRFFVDILGDFWKFFKESDSKEGNVGTEGIVFDKEAFIKNASSKQNQYFLEWFTETAMFNHFISNMAICHKRQLSDSSSIGSDPSELVDAPLPNFYELFQERLRCKGKSSTQKMSESTSKTNYKSAVNKKVKLLKNKLKDLVG